MSITLTEPAAREVQKYKESQNSAESFLRIKVLAGGCSGYQYGLNLDTNYDEEKDSKYTFHGVDLVVDEKSELFMDGVVVNYVETLEQRGFHIDNPQAKKTCGCGSSFQV